MALIEEVIKKKTELTGPLPDTPASYPFDSMQHCRKPYDLHADGYVEQEFFISGFANVYGTERTGAVCINRSNLPYRTRILVRRPEEKRRFSGRVYLDILNATNCYDHEDLWTRIYDWCVENGHGYVGITSKPVTVQALKNFDYLRYCSLDWSNGEPIPRPTASVYPSIPGTEEGLFWDMLSQTAAAIRYGGTKNLFDGWTVDALYLTGQSQSGAYLNTYIKYFGSEDGVSRTHRLYDGFVNLVGTGVQYPLHQKRDINPLTLDPRDYSYTGTTPYMNITSEGDVSLFSGFGVLYRKPQNEPVNKNVRFYDVPGSPHYDITCPVVVSDGDIIKTGHIPHKMPEKSLFLLNDFPLRYYIIGILQKLDDWVNYGTVPEPSLRFIFSDGRNLARDDYGNVRGGLRSPFLDVPVASYKGFDARSDQSVGSMKFFTKDEFLARYQDRDEYLRQFTSYVDRQYRQRWLPYSAVDFMKKWALRKSLEILKM
jgi:hypothetical protein